jgi:hypothetical protein
MAAMKRQGIGQCGSNRRGCNKPHSGDPAFLACPMPGEEFFFDRLDLRSEFHQLHDEEPKSYARQGTKLNNYRLTPVGS